MVRFFNSIRGIGNTQAAFSPGKVTEDGAAATAFQEFQHEGYGENGHTDTNSVSTSQSSDEEKEKKNARTHVFEIPSDLAEVLLQYDPFTYNSILDEYMEVILTHLDDRSVDEWIQILKKSNDYHNNDNLIPRNHREFLKRLEDGPFDDMSETDWELLVKFESFLYYEWSVYPEVRAVTVPIDEEDDEDYETFRVYVLGTAWAMAACVLDTFFEPRYPQIGIGAGAIQLLIAICGRTWAKLPYIAIPLWKGRKFVINNGRRWTFREQMLASLTMSVSIGAVYTQDLIISLSNKNFFNVPTSEGADSFGFIFLITISTALMGFSVAGLQRSFFVYPTKMVFFDSLPINTLNRVLVRSEQRENVNGWKLKTYEFFWIFGLIWFSWFWVTSLAFTALSTFNWPAWIAPNNVHLQAITGAYNGLAFFPINSFDPNQLGFSSLYTPWNALWQIYASIVVSMIAVIIIWYTNVRYTGYFPINYNGLFDNTGQSYNTTRIFNSKFELDVEAYENYSEPYYSAGGLVDQGLAFMVFPAQFVDSLLNNWRDFADSFKAFKMLFKFRSSDKVLDQFDDRFSRVVRKYPEASEWWFALIFLISFGIAVAVVEHWKFVNTPVWSIVLSCSIALVFLLPQNALRARTTCFYGTGELINLVNGILLEGNPIGLFTSAIYSNSFASQSDNYVDNQKIGHYAGIAPRSLFRCQILSVICCTFVEAGIMQWQASGALGEDFCSYEAQSTTKFTCMSTRSNFLTMIVWGAISPKRIFNGVYPKLKWVFLIGALYPLPLFFLRKFGRSLTPDRGLWYKLLNNSFIEVIDPSIWITSAGNWAPGNFFNGSNLGDFMIGIFWHKWLRVRKPQWWAKYTYLFVNSISVGLAFAGLFIFFATEYHHIVNPPDWWGNNVVQSTADSAGGLPRLQIPAKGYFGPDPGTFPNKV